MKPCIGLAAFVMSTIACLAPTSAADAVPGRVMLAEASGDALIIWNASPVVAAIVRSKISDAQADDMLAHDAARVLITMLPNIDRHSRTVTVRLIYDKSGAVSAAYGGAVFGGFERYALLTAPASYAVSDKDRWRELKTSQGLPSWFSYKVIGRLPPRA